MFFQKGFIGICTGVYERNDSLSRAVGVDFTKPCRAFTRLQAGDERSYNTYWFFVRRDQDGIAVEFNFRECERADGIIQPGSWKVSDGAWVGCDSFQCGGDIQDEEGSFGVSQFDREGRFSQCKQPGAW